VPSKEIFAKHYRNKHTRTRSLENNVGSVGLEGSVVTECAQERNKTSSHITATFCLLCFVNNHRQFQTKQISHKIYASLRDFMSNAATARVPRVYTQFLTLDFSFQFFSSDLKYVISGSACGPAYILLKNPPLGPILRQANPVHPFTSCFSGYWLDGRVSEVKPLWGQDFSSFHVLQIDSVANPPSYTKNTVDPYPGD
jgi:hypothetical protein